MIDKLQTAQTIEFDRVKQLLLMPQNTLVIMCGPSGSGKSTFATNHFPQTAVVSTDNCRTLVSDNARNMECSYEAFDLAYIIVGKRLKLGRTTVFDSTALALETRQRLREIAASHHFQTLLIVLQTSFQTCQMRDSARIWPSPVGKQVLLEQFVQFEETIAHIRQEAFDYIVFLESSEVNKIHVRLI